MKSASGKREKNTTAEKKPADRSNAARPEGKKGKKVHTPLCPAKASRDCADSAPNSKIRAKFRQTFPHVCSVALQIVRSLFQFHQSK